MYEQVLAFNDHLADAHKPCASDNARLIGLKLNHYTYHRPAIKYVRIFVRI